MPSPSACSSRAAKIRDVKVYQAVAAHLIQPGACGLQRNKLGGTIHLLLTKLQAGFGSMEAATNPLQQQHHTHCPESRLDVLSRTKMLC